MYFQVKDPSSAHGSSVLGLGMGTTSRWVWAWALKKILVHTSIYNYISCFVVGPSNTLKLGLLKAQSGENEKCKTQDEIQMETDLLSIQ